MDEFRIEFTVQRSADGWRTITDLAVGSSASWGTMADAADAAASAIEDYVRHTNNGSGDA